MDHGPKRSVCIICRKRIEHKTPEWSGRINDPTKLRHALADCLSLKLEEIPANSGPDLLCLMCEYRLKEWMDLENVIADLIIRARRIRATLTCLVLKSRRKPGPVPARFRNCERIRSLVLKEYDVRVVLERHQDDSDRDTLQGQDARVNSIPASSFRSADLMGMEEEEAQDQLAEETHDCNNQPIEAIRGQPDINSELERPQVGEERIGRCTFNIHGENYVCKPCGKRIKTRLPRTHLREHVKFQHPELLTPEQVCGRRADDQAIVKVGPGKYVYRGRMSFEFRDGMYYCGLCPSSFTSSVSLVFAKKQLLKHLRKYHAYQCSRSGAASTVQPSGPSSDVEVNNKVGLKVNETRRVKARRNARHGLIKKYNVSGRLKVPQETFMDKISEAEFVYRGKIPYKLVDNSFVCGACGHARGGKWRKKNIFSHFRTQHQDILRTSDGDQEDRAIDEADDKEELFDHWLVKEEGPSLSQSQINVGSGPGTQNTDINLKIECLNSDGSFPQTALGMEFHTVNVDNSAHHGDDGSILQGQDPLELSFTDHCNGDAVPNEILSDPLSSTSAELHSAYSCSLCSCTFSGPESESHYLDHMNQAHGGASAEQLPSYDLTSLKFEV